MPYKDKEKHNQASVRYRIKSEKKYRENFLLLKPTSISRTIQGYIKYNFGACSTLAHRHIMSVHLKRLVESYEEVHHKNRIRDDNRIENLEIINFKGHSPKWHRLLKIIEHQKQEIQRLKDLLNLIGLK